MQSTKCQNWYGARTASTDTQTEATTVCLTTTEYSQTNGSVQTQRGKKNENLRMVEEAEKESAEKIHAISWVLSIT